MIKCIKLSTGEEIIGEVSDTIDGGALNINTPVSIMMVPTQQGQFTVALIPFLPYAETKQFRFQSDNIILVFEPNADMRNEYNRITGKGLVVPPGPGGISLVK